MGLSSQDRMGTKEFIALTAMLFSVVAFSIDIFLAAMPEIARELGAYGKVHLLITGFIAGMALGTLVAGPVSDAIGRRTTIFIGAGLYIVSGLIAWSSQTFEALLFARILQGVGAAAPRVVSIAIVRDLYTGRNMARIVSLAMVVFALVPTLAPTLGAVLEGQFGWRSIFLSLIIFMTVALLWLGFRLSESLPSSERRAFCHAHLSGAMREIAAHPMVRLAIIAQGLSLALIFGLIVQVQAVYDHVFDKADSFPYWFGGVALLAAVSTSFANARLVMIFGMRRMATFGMLGQAVVAGLAVTTMTASPDMLFEVFVVWQFLLIWLTGLMVGNLNALALEPMGHIAGFTASVSGFVGTALAALLATVTGFFFDGTPYPLLVGSCIIATVGSLMMLRITTLDQQTA